jgi:hypothetical protein
MKTIELFSGGHKFHNEDFEYLRDGSLSVFLGTIKGLKLSTEDVVLLDGLTISGASTARTWTEGIIYYNENFYTVPAQVSAIDIANYSFDLTTEAAANNPVTYKDGSSKNVHITNKLSIRNDLSGVLPATIISTEKSISEQIASKIINENTINVLPELLVEYGWINAVTDFTYESGITSNASYPVQYRIIGDLIEFRGVLDNSNTADNPILWSSVPSSIIPTIGKRAAIGVSTGNDRIGSFLIDAAGVVKSEYTAGGTTATIFLDGLKYYI